MPATALHDVVDRPGPSRPADSHVPAPGLSKPSERSGWSARRLKRPLMMAGGALAGMAFLPYLFSAYLVCGLLDFTRNREKTLASWERYFVGNGLFTWLLSPFNLLMDLLCQPHQNKGVYRLTDLPPDYQCEIHQLLAAVHEQDLVGQLQSRMSGHQRGMIFFKWYGRNLPTSLDVPEFHQPFRYIRTIGVSVFNKRQSTGKHFGPLRVTLRLLYNINPIDSDQVYIQVGGHTNYWRDNPLFIFDDTLQHQSVNGSDAVRYCMFVDILRPSLVPRVMSAILASVRVIVAPFNAVFYQKWTFVK
ncbi:MAG: aspartyl/asparaginyl beta-hydroxylase domain-containing protein [Planctomycetaceae bacterium]